MSELKPISSEMREALRKPFPSEAITQHPTKTFLSTIKAIYIAERLNDVFGVGRWEFETVVEERTDDYVLVKGKLATLDYDVVVPAQYGGHGTTGKNTEIADGYKSAVTDALSKCASYLEIGIDVFKGKVKNNSSNNNISDSAPEKKETTGEKCKDCSSSDFKVSKKTGKLYCFPCYVRYLDSKK